MPFLPSENPNPDEISTAQSVFQTWQSGNQQGAIDLLRPLADEGRSWAVSFLPWLFMQMGYPRMTEGIPYAVRAAEMGSPWAASNLFNNLIGNIGADPSLLDRALELAEATGPTSIGIDPVGQGWNLLSQGRAEQALRMMGLRAPYPLSEPDWRNLAHAARSHLDQIQAQVALAREASERVSVAASDGLAAIDKSRVDVETSAKQAGLLVTSVVSDSAASLFKADAERNEKQSKSAWIAGLVVLVGAACFAIAPLVVHYLGGGPDYSLGALLAAHAGSTAALATVAGVLLARGRARDLARERANDLSTAMGTMIGYSNQIRDEEERQRFMMTMGQLVLQAHLTAGGQGHRGDDSMTGLIALANLVRPPGPGPTG